MNYRQGIPTLVIHKLNLWGHCMGSESCLGCRYPFYPFCLIDKLRIRPYLWLL